jgi:hypothetical protein
MTRVHFVWAGEASLDSAHTAMANQIRESGLAEVHFWFYPGDGPVVRPPALREGIRVHSVKQELWSLAGRSVKVEKVDDILSFFLANRGNGPAKDLITFILLATQGGYFFDGNCMILDRDKFRSALSSPPQQPAFLRLEGGEFLYNPAKPSQLAKLPVEEGYFALTMDFMSGTAEPWNTTDMWAMYAPEGGHDIFWAIARSYVKRAKALGLRGEPPPSGTVSAYGRENFTTSGDLRRSLAGSLGIASIITGWREFQHPASDDWVSATVQRGLVQGGPDKGHVIDRSANHWVAALGIAKVHGETWTK